MKKRKYIIGLIIILLIIIGVIFFSFFKKQKEIYFNWQKEKIKVYEIVNLKDRLIDSNATIIDTKLKTEEVGIEKQEFTYKYKGQKYKGLYEYEVIDDEKPKIFGGASKSVDINYDGNLCDLIMIADNYDRYLDCKITGEYDLTKEGSYKIKYIVTDSSLNEATYNLTLKVVRPYNNTSKIPVNNVTVDMVKEKYQKSDLEFGIDVSKWQEDVDYNLVKEEGVSFVMLRIGIRSGIGEKINMDSYYLKNIKKAKEAGLKVGIYLYSKAQNVLEAIEEAQWIINALNGEKLELPIVFDWENWSNWNQFHLNFNDLNDLALNFIQVVEEAGYEGMLYSSKFYLENFWFDKMYPKIWLAHYTENTSYLNYDMWQFTNQGVIKGIKGNVDFDLLKEN